MTRLVQVGVGSGGMTVLDILCRDARIEQVTLIEPDLYKPHNVVRHLFPLSAVGQRKADLAVRWLQERRAELAVDALVCDLLDPAYAEAIEAAAQRCGLGVCAADNEPAKFHFDALMRRHRKPWTLGEVLSGGIGGFVHRFVPGGPCYGCVASFLRRSVAPAPGKMPDYSQPGGPAPETTIPASRASIEVIASLHAHITLQLLTDAGAPAPGFTSLLLTLEKVPGMFEESFRTHRFRIPRAADCLICREEIPAGNLDQELDEALARLNQP